MPSVNELTTMALEQVLGGWLSAQRWFGGKGRPVTGLAITAETELTEPGADPALWHLIVAVSQESSHDDYQILVGLRHELPRRLEHARIGMLPDGRSAYDALHDHELSRVLLRGMAAGTAQGPVRLRPLTPGPFLDGPLASEAIESLVLTGEQSNTSLVYAEEAILKVFRRISPGPNPDLEVSVALARLGSTHVARPLGWIETGGAGDEVTILAILSEYLRAAADAWSLAATSVRDLYAAPGTSAADAGGDFAGEAERLGRATAEVHRDLLAAFGGELLPPGSVAALAGPMRHRLEEALTAVPALREYAPMLERAYAELTESGDPLPVQRIHGDYHLGQVMRTQTGWVVLDFEGEPAVPLAVRRAAVTPLRDVAGMLRSFGYAARSQLLGHPDRNMLELAARDWVRRNSDAFCAGYAEAGGQDARQSAVLLQALQFDKAVYEVMYEARNRPSWLPIPLDSLAAGVPALKGGD